MRMLILGPPGAGKGTQAGHIADSLGVPAISTGQIFRDNIESGTELGRQVKETIEAGRFVSDELTNEIVFARLSQPDAANGYLLDGYPRTVEQALALRAFHQAQGVDIGHVLELVVPDDIIVERILKRAAIEGRADDTEEIARERMRTYHAETKPISDMARERGLLVQVDGVGTVDEVFERCMAALGHPVTGA